MIRFLETPVHHASDFLRWYEGSGYSDSSIQPALQGPFDLIFTTAPSDLETVHKSHGVVFWRRQPAALHAVIEGRASGSDLEPPVETPFALAGSISDQAGRYNPRLFNLSAGNGGGHNLALYRSPLGSQFGVAGGVYGNLVYEDESAASWALVTVTVSPSIGDPIVFVGQADARGDFILPLTRMPLLNSDAPSSTHPATLAVSADGYSGSEARDPESFADYLLEDFSSPGSFVASASFAAEPGKIDRLASAGNSKQQLVLRPDT